MIAVREVGLDGFLGQLHGLLALVAEDYRGPCRLTRWFLRRSADASDDEERKQHHEKRLHVVLPLKAPCAQF